MLTFRFSKADGCMVVPETLTSGMTGKQVKLEFSSDWDDLTKTAVFIAGSVIRDVVGISGIVTIPAEVLAAPVKRLYVGVYGVSADGRVTPTIRVPGPEIKPGVDPSGDPGTEPDLPVWAQLEKEIDELKRNGSGGLGDEAAALLISILREAQYISDQSDRITTLEALLKSRSDSSSDGSGDGGDEAVKAYTVTYALTNVESSNTGAAVEEGGAFVTTLTATDGRSLSVTVTMGGEDITATAYSNGSIAISAVTGDIVITAVTVDTSILYQLKDTAISAAIDTGVYLMNENRDFTICADIVFEQDFTANDNTLFYVVNTDDSALIIGGKYGVAQQRVYLFGQNKVLSSLGNTPFRTGHAFKVVLTYEAFGGTIKTYGATSINKTAATGEASASYTQSLKTAIVNKSNTALYVNDLTIMNRVLTAEEAAAYVTI